MNKSKAKGTAAETAVTRWLQTNGFPTAERRALAGNADLGDILACPGVVIEVKAGAAARGAGQVQVAHWLVETETERVNAGAAIGLLVVQRLNRARSGPAGWQAWLPLWATVALVGGPDQMAAELRCAPWSTSLYDATALLRHGGYGQPTEGTST